MKAPLLGEKLVLLYAQKDEMEALKIKQNVRNRKANSGQEKEFIATVDGLW